MTIINNSAAAQPSGMSISKSNVLVSRVPVITSAGAGENAANISSPDHSLNYTSGSSLNYFSVAYGIVQNVDYVGISGHTAAGVVGVTIELYDATTLIDSVTVSRNNNIMFTFAQRTFTNLIVKFVTSTVTQQVTLSFIAAGQHINIEGGEQAGYARNWLMRSTEDRVTTNLLAAPVGVTKKNVPLKGMLSLPNQTAVFVEGVWQNFIDFSYEQPFFIKEVSTKPNSSYICFNPKHGVKAHSQTRLLDVLTLAFIAYNGV